MRHTITFLSRDDAQNGYGEELVWSEMATCFASVEPLIGNEFYTADATQSKVELKFRCWYFDSPAISNENRVRYNANDYEILSVVDYKNLNREWLIYAKKVVE